MKTLFQHENIEAWKAKHPRLWWAFQQLNDEDDLRDQVLAAILNHRENDDEALDHLLRFTEALEAFQRATNKGTVRPPPDLGERRSFSIFVSRMTRMRSNHDTFFRVDFFSPDGWGGFFDTTNPGVVERISRLRNHANPLTVVGEVSRRMYEFYVELDRSLKIV